MKLKLTLKDQIDGVFEAFTAELLHDYCILNISFKIDRITADGQDCSYTTESRAEDNFQLIRIADMNRCSKISIEYHGILDGTTGLYPYARETSAGDFVPLRHETLYFPVFLGLPSEEDWYTKYFQMALDIDFCVDRPRTALSNLTLSHVEDHCYHFSGTYPTIIAGSFEQTPVPGGTLSFRLEDNISPKHISAFMQNVFGYMNDTYGHADLSGVELVTIPSGFGSFVVGKKLFLALDAVRNERSFMHELIHLGWNPNQEIIPSEIQQCRLFDEGLTQYLMAQIYEIMHPGSLPSTYSEFRKYYQTCVNEWGIPVCPLTSYSKCYAGDLAYGYGPFLFHEIEENIGKDALTNVIRQMISDYQTHPMTFDSFRNLFRDYNITALLDSLLLETDFQTKLLS